MIFVVLLGSLCFTGLATKMLGDAGIGWHIRTGQQILSTHHIPRVDPYSSIMSGKPLDRLGVALRRNGRRGWIRALGLNGVVWLNALLIAGTFAITFQSMHQARHKVVCRSRTDLARHIRVDDPCSCPSPRGLVALRRDLVPAFWMARSKRSLRVRLLPEAAGCGCSPL